MGLFSKKQKPAEPEEEEVIPPKPPGAGEGWYLAEVCPHGKDRDRWWCHICEGD